LIAIAASKNNGEVINNKMIAPKKIHALFDGALP